MIWRFNLVATCRFSQFGFRIQSLRLGAQEFGFGIQRLGFGVWSLGCGAQSSKLTAQGLGRSFS